MKKKKKLLGQNNFAASEYAGCTLLSNQHLTPDSLACKPDIRAECAAMKMLELCNTVIAERLAMEASTIPYLVQRYAEYILEYITRRDASGPASCILSDTHTRFGDHIGIEDYL